MNDSTLTRPAVNSVYIRALYQAINYRYLFSKALHQFPVSLFGFSDGQWEKFLSNYIDFPLSIIILLKL